VFWRVVDVCYGLQQEEPHMSARRHESPSGAEASNKTRNSELEPLNAGKD